MSLDAPHYEIHRLVPFRRNAHTMDMAHPRAFDVEVRGCNVGGTIYGCAGTGDTPKLAARDALRHAPAAAIELAAEVLRPLLGE